LLTEEEYTIQGDLETMNALRELRDYCRSPKCDAWRTMSHLQDPLRFAKFVGGSPHLSDDEVTVYENSLYPNVVNCQAEDDSSSNDDESISFDEPYFGDISSIRPEDALIT